MLGLLRQFNQVRYPYDTADQKRRANLQLILANVIGCVVIVLLGIALLLDLTDTTDVSSSMMGILLVGLVLVPIVHYLVQTGYQETSTYLFVLGITLTYLVVFFASPSAENIAIVGFIVPILSAAVLLNVRVMLVVGGMLFGAYLVSVGLQITNESFPERIDAYDYAIQSTQSVLVMAVVTLFLLYYHVDGANRTAQENIHISQVVQSISQISKQLSGTPVTDDFYKRIVEVIRDAFELHSVHLFTRTASEQQFELVAATGLIGLRLVSEGRRIDVGRETTVGLAYRQKRAVRTTMQSPLEQRVDFLLATRSELVVPLLSAEHEVIGLLVLHSEEDEAFHEQEIALVETIASELALIFEQRQLERRLRNLEQQLRDGQRHYEDLEVELKRLRQEVEGHVWDDYLSLRHKVAGFEWDGDKASAWYNDEMPVARKAYIENTEDGRKRIVVPIIFGDEPYGDMIFEADEDVAWSKQTLDLASAVANRLALALDNARLFDQAQTIALREQLVSSVASELQETRNIELLVNRAAVLFNRVLSAEQTHVRMRVAHQQDNANVDKPVADQ